MTDHFVIFAVILALGAVLGSLGALLRQPLIVAFIVVGVIAGPSWLDLTSQHDQLELLSRVGVTILLFLVGLRLDLHTIRTMGPVALATGLGQVFFTSVVGFVICLLLGVPIVPSIYIAVALTFSSTIIIVKLLSDKREIDSLHGRIAVGFLIVQDLMVVLAMILLSAFGVAGESTPAWAVVKVAMAGMAMLIAVIFMAIYVWPRVVRMLARVPELMVLTAVAWAVGLAAVGQLVGFSSEVGGFLAGVSLATTPFRDAIGGRLVSLRDILLLFFFVELGAGLEFDQITSQIGPAIVLSLFVLIGNPIIVMVIMGVMGYTSRTSFLAGLAVAQISEFSLILGAMGVAVGHLPDEWMGLITLVGLITIGASTYMILYSHPLYQRLSPLLRVFQRKGANREHLHDMASREADVIVFGLGRFGFQLVTHLQQHKVSVLCVDFDPQAVEAAQKRGWAAQFGDAEDPDFISQLPLDSARLVFCAAPGYHTNLTLLRNLRHTGYRGPVFLTAHHRHDAEALIKADNVVMVCQPFMHGAHRAAEEIMDAVAKSREV